MLGDVSLIYSGTQVDEALLWELFVQAGPVVNVHMPEDRVTKQHQVMQRK